VFAVAIRLVNFCRVTFWRLVFRLRGGRLGRRCTIQPGVCLACARHRPIVIGNGVRLMRGVVLSTAESGRIELGDNVYTRISQIDMTFRDCDLGLGDVRDRDRIVQRPMAVVDSRLSGKSRFIIHIGSRKV